MINSQTKIFKNFSGSVQLSVLKIITKNCHMETIMYIPVGDLWLNRLYFQISNRNDNIKININLIGPGKYRTNAENPEKTVVLF